jgi:hypothetical protein
VGITWKWESRGDLRYVVPYRGTEKFVEFRKMEISHPKIFNFPILRLKLAKLVPGDSPLFADFKDTNLSIC